MATIMKTKDFLHALLAK